MGQVNATASPHSFVQPFVNLPKEAILSLWLSYNLLGEGWALTQDQFVSIFQEATFIKDKYRFGITELGHLFTSFDTDANGLVDALEILVTIGLLSGEPPALSHPVSFLTVLLQQPWMPWIK